MFCNQNDGSKLARNKRSFSLIIYDENASDEAQNTASPFLSYLWKGLSPTRIFV